MRRRLLLLPVAALLAVLAFVARPERAPSAARFSDREIFEGALFGVGPVATLLPEARDQLRPELYARNADELASMSAARAALIARIESTQPGLIGEFARVARSGDPAAIRSMLERAAEAVNAAGRTEVPGGTLYANVPDGPRFPGPSRPRPVAPQNETQPLYANVPDGPRFPGPSRPRPVAPQSETALGSLTTDPVSAQPAWAFFGSQLFSEQLAASMARTLEHSVASGG